MNIFTKFTEYIHYVSHCPCAPSPMFPSKSIHYYGNVPHHPCVPLPMCPIAHVAYCPCAPLPYSHVDLERDMPHCPYAPSLLVPNHPPMCPITLPLVLMCPIAHVFHCSCGLMPMHPIILLPCRSRRAHCPYAHHLYSHE